MLAISIILPADDINTLSVDKDFTDTMVCCLPTLINTESVDKKIPRDINFSFGVFRTRYPDMA